MRKVIDRSKKVLHYAKAVRDVVDRIPSAAGDINRMVSTASSAFQQMRLDASDVISGLKTERDEDFVDIIKETTLNQEYILSRGYFLSGVNLDLGSTFITPGGMGNGGGQLTLHLRNIAAGQTGDYFRRDLPRGWNESPTMKAVLFAIERASSLSTQISEFGFVPHEIQVVAGSIPSIQVFWKNPLVDEFGRVEENEGDIDDDANSSANLIRGTPWKPEEGFFPPTARNAGRGESSGIPEKEKHKILDTKPDTGDSVSPKRGEEIEDSPSQDPLAKFKIRPRVVKR